MMRILLFLLFALLVAIFSAPAVDTATKNMRRAAAQQEQD